MMRTVALLSGLVVCTVGCGDDGATPGSDAGAAPDASSEDSGSVDAGNCEGLFAEGISGRVVDTHGNPPMLPQIVTLCANACIYGDVLEDGSFRVEAGFCYSGSPPLSRPVLIYHGLGRYADLNYDFIGPEGGDYVEWVHFDEPLRIPPLEDMTVLTVDTSIPQALDDGAGFRLTVEAGATELPFRREHLAVVRVAEADYPPVAGVETLTALWALIHDDTFFDPPARLELPNIAGDPPGTPIEVVGIGNFSTAEAGAPQPYAGTLGVVATASVSADGASIALDAGEGIPILTWLGYRPRR